MKALTVAFLLAIAHRASAATVILKLRPPAAHKLSASAGLPFRVVTIPDDAPGALAALQAQSGGCGYGLPVCPAASQALPPKPSRTRPPPPA
jgi:hypothetical protein